MRSLQTAKPLTLFAPAKVNLGLEVCGRRDDGYHNVVTVMETVSLFDVIRLEPGASLSVISEIESAGEPDLVRLALERLQEALDLSICVRVHVEKRIPVAAGLGGGSSDAGAVLAAMRQLFDIDTGTIHGIASGLGSDVPFFLEGGVALAEGTGTSIYPIRTSSRRWYVISCPDFQVQNKTETLYGQLTCDDFSDGSSTRSIASCLGRNEPVDQAQLINAFSRPLNNYRQTAEAVRELARAGARRVFPSGAGPSVFTICESFQEATSIQTRLRHSIGRTWVATSTTPDINASRIARAR